ncbi:MAG TPA: AAA family ATPase, partial [Sporichthya sp.]|nr:AAA family ATPase [Sporichthya sp.]
YFGPTLNRAARLMAAGAGGQVLCSQAAAVRLADGAAPGIVLVDLGEHRLADLGRAERVYQVSEPSTPAVFPPLRSLGAHRHNLPVAPDAFVGRAAELAELDRLLEGTRLLSLLGAGGSGKTRLALHLAAGAVERFADGVWLVELASLRDDALVPSAAAAALGLDTTGYPTPQALVEHLGSWLAPKRILLLIDNCEHLIDAAAQLIHDLLARCPQLTVLATSREVLGVPGETAWRVPPLSVPAEGMADPSDLAAYDAVALFLERAQAARPGFDLGAGNAADVVRICRRLDGIPLALELAVGRIPTLGIRAVAERLDDVFGLLSSGARTAVPRHRTLRATLDWSYGLLAQDEQAALRRLAVFQTGFALDAAEAVLGADPVDLLTRLVDKSLVTVFDASDEAVRYRLLQPVRQYAHEHLVAAGEEPDALRRHREHFRRVADGFFGPPVVATAAWLARVSADYGNIRDALTDSLDSGDLDTGLWLAGRMFPYWILDGRALEGRAWLERALAAHPAPPGPEHAWGLVALGLLDVYTGEVATGEAHLSAACAVAGSGPLAGVYARGYLGALALRGPDTAEAERVFDACRAEFEAAEVGPGVAFCDFNRAWTLLAHGDLAGAGARFASADAIGRSLGSDVMVVHARAALATVRALEGDPASGNQLAADAVAAARSSGLRQMLVMATARAAETAGVSGDLPRAGAYARETLAAIRELGVRMWVTESLLVAALVLADRDSELAARLLGAGGYPPEPGGPGLPLSVALDAGAARLRGVLGPGPYEAALREGAAWSADEAIELALAGLRDPQQA